VGAVFTAAPASQCSQSAIDARSGDIEWIGAIGYRHQDVVKELMKQTAVVPLRAFTLFSSEESLRSYLHEHAASLDAALNRLAGKQEWTIRIEIEAARWADALVTRVDALRALKNDIETAAPGKAFLLRKKLDDEKKKLSRVAELDLVAEIEAAIVTQLGCETLAEPR